jgi:hypothetical protein
MKWSRTVRFVEDGDALGGRDVIGAAVLGDLGDERHDRGLAGTPSTGCCAAAASGWTHQRLALGASTLDLGHPVSVSHPRSPPSSTSACSGRG